MTPKTAISGSTIVATMSSLHDQQMTIKITSDIKFSDYHKIYYVNGYKVMKSSGKVSKTERHWCMVDFEVINKE